MRYLPHTEQDVAEMLRVVGVGSIDELFRSLPRQGRLDGALDLPQPMDEAALSRHLADLAAKNWTDSCSVSFMGCGAYAHQVPAAVDAVISRGEFFTAYTPYQPEVSQGTLQALFEFQTMVAELFGQDVANASMYDAASAAAEAVLMARRLQRKRTKVVLSAGLHPEYRQTVHTYLSGMEDLDVIEVGLGPDGRTDPAGLAAVLDADSICLVMQSPNYLGIVEDMSAASQAAASVKAIGIAVVGELTSLGLLEAPGKQGYEIVVGDGLGMAGPLSLGGPGVGLMATTDRNKRALPGRLVGQTLDRDGRVGYVLTLAAREQHIRREKATSNICSNHSLVALALAVHLSLLGRKGFSELARLNFSKATYLRKRFAQAGLLAFPDSPHYNEFALRIPGGDAAALARDLFEQEGILAGVSLGRFDEQMADLLLVNVTERHSRKQLDAFYDAVTARIDASAKGGRS